MDHSLAESAARQGALWGARPGDWAENEAQQLPTYEEAIRRVGIEPGDAVLDVGCGAGTFLRLAADRGARAFGVDAAEGLIELARRRAPGADLRVGDLQALPYEDFSFDLITGFNSFFFAADMGAALREARRVARPGAAVVIQVWGRPERCELRAVVGALASLRGRPARAGAPLWKPGVLEELAREAGLTPSSAFDLSYAFEYPDERTLVRRVSAAGAVVEAVRAAGEQLVAELIVESLAPYRTPKGGFRLENEWHYLVATA